MSTDPERDRLSARLGRAAQVGSSLAATGLRAGTMRLFGGDNADQRIAQALAQALGQTKGPLMKVAQMLATVPDFLPQEYADELARLQAHAPPMSWPFVNRRMRAELGPDWQARFGHFEPQAAHAASLGQVHRASLLDGRPVAAKLQYPDMASAVESDVGQLRQLLSLYKALDKAVDPSEVVDEIADRLREELDYAREAKHMRLYGQMLASQPDIRVPSPVEDLSTGRLLVMDWLQGEGLLTFKQAPPDTRNRIARLLFQAWWSPLNGYGVIHGDPHLGNYTLTPQADALNLLDFGCVRIFPPDFVGGVVRLRQALLVNDRDSVVSAFEDWGFKGLNAPVIEALTLWARFIYGPLLDHRVRTVADGIAPGEYGRKEAFAVRALLKQHGPVAIPRTFVFMDRAAIGLGAAFLHLGAELDYATMFDQMTEGFSVADLANRQAQALAQAGLAGAT